MHSCCAAAGALALAAVAATGAPPPPPPPPWFPRVPCVDDTDCALNGVCSGGACRCDRGWEGRSCEALALRAAPDVGAYGGWGDPNVSSWGASVAEVGGEYHMFVSEFWGGCGVTSWQHTSHLVHATAGTPEGPFRYADTVVSRFSHNPRVFWENGSLILWHIGDGEPGWHGDCTDGGLCDRNCSAPCTCDAAAPLPRETWPTYDTPAPAHIAASPGGPWRPLPSAKGCDNPSPARHPNGTVFLACRGIALYSAPSATGPWGPKRQIQPSRFVQVNSSLGQIINVGMEDPFLWFDRRGNFHLLLHCSGAAHGSPVGCHAFSRDGAEWTWSATPPYSAAVPHRGGSTAVYATRERPSLLFDGAAAPVALYTGVVYPRDRPGKHPGLDASFTLMQPIA